MWIDSQEERDPDPINVLDHEDSTTSSVSLGDTHIWRENGDNNV
jgi:hypothetical protein